MASYEFSALAEGDALDIWCHIAADRPLAADRMLSRIHQAAARCAGFPGLGRRRLELSDDARVLPVDSYLLIYHPVPAGIIIDRILHAARDIDTEFSE